MHSWAPAVATAGAVALVVGGLAAVGASGGEPPLTVATSYGTGDGLHRYVVTLTATTSGPTEPGTTTAAAPGPAAGATPTAPPPTEAPALGQGGPAATRLPVDAALLRAAQVELGSGGDVIADGDVVYYVTALGARAVSAGAVVGAVVAATAPLAAPDRPVSRPAASVLEALAARPGVTAVTPLDVGGDALVSTHLDLGDVLALPEVAAASPSVEVPVLGIDPTDPFYGPYAWNLHNTGSNAYQKAATAGADVDAPTGWAVTHGQGTVVAVVDTGFDSDHPDLAGALWTNPAEACGTLDTNGNGKVGDCHGWNFWTGSPDIDNGAAGSHGTAVSGVVAARMDNGQGSVGLAPGTQIMPLVAGSGESVDVYLAAQAIRYAADNGADVVNASFGGAFTGPALTALSAAIDYATDRGVVVVAAAGNDSADRDTSPVYPASLPQPLLLTVGSSTPTDSVAAHSAYGATTVDLFAPGEAIVTPWNDGGYRAVAGTSFAAPHVAAAVALYRSVNPDASVADLRADLLADVEHLASMAGRSVTGGRLDVAAVQGATAEPVRYSFAGMVGTPGVQHPEVTVTSAAGTGVYQAVLGLAMLVDGEIWAVAGQDMTVRGATLTTDDTGQVTVDLGAQAFLGTEVLAPELALDEGSFGLTVQILLDGQPLSRPYAAPLRVVAAEQTTDDAGGSAGGGTGGGSGDAGAGGGSGDAGAGGDSGDTGSGGSGGTGSGSGDSGSGGTGTGGTDTGTGTGTGTGTDTGTSGSGGAGTGDSGAGDSGGSGTGEGADGTSPTTGPTPAGPGSSGGSGTSPTPAPGPAAPGPGGTGAPDATSYDGVGAFGVTRIGPVHVPTSGGTLVVVTATALEPGTGVRIGATAPGRVLLTTPTTLVFLTPPAVAGVHDVTLFRLARTSVLPGALTYQDVVAPGGGTAPGATEPAEGGTGGPGSGSTGPGSTGSDGSGAGDAGSADTPSGGTGSGGTGSGDAGSGDGSAGSGDGGSGDGSAGSGDPGSGDTGGSTPTAPAATRTGPHGERLVRNDALASLAGLWSLGCATTCAGMQV